MSFCKNFNNFLIANYSRFKNNSRMARIKSELSSSLHGQLILVIVEISLLVMMMVDVIKQRI